MTKDELIAKQAIQIANLEEKVAKLELAEDNFVKKWVAVTEALGLSEFSSLQTVTDRITSWEGTIDRIQKQKVSSVLDQLEKFTEKVFNCVRGNCYGDVVDELNRNPKFYREQCERYFKAGWDYRDAWKMIAFTSEEFDEEWACQEQAKIQDKYRLNSAGV